MSVDLSLLGQVAQKRKPANLHWGWNAKTLLPRGPMQPDVSRTQAGRAEMAVAWLRQILQGANAKAQQVQQKQQSAIGMPVKLPTPGVNPSIATDIPQAPSSGIPTLVPISGWLSAGRNYTQNPF